ncbi:hypothetical protein Hdeb2414_s0009g00307521 [Helianthus debilis subsp. tardiflorus]
MVYPTTFLGCSGCENGSCRKYVPRTHEMGLWALGPSPKPTRLNLLIYKTFGLFNPHFKTNIDLHTHKPNNTHT